MNTLEQSIRIAAFLTVLYEDEEARQWWESPQSLLEGRTPSALWEEGKGEELVAMLARLADGAYL